MAIKQFNAVCLYFCAVMQWLVWKTAHDWWELLSAWLAQCGSLSQLFRTNLSSDISVFMSRVEERFFASCPSGDLQSIYQDQDQAWFWKFLILLYILGPYFDIKTVFSCTCAEFRIHIIRIRRSWNRHVFMLVTRHLCIEIAPNVSVLSGVIDS